MDQLAYYDFRFHKLENFCKYIHLIPKIDMATKKQIVKALQEIEANYTDKENKYVHQKIKKKLITVKECEILWIRELSDGYKALYDYYRYLLVENKKSKNCVLEIKRIGAALFYFVNPFGVIPDHILLHGFSDDAFVFNITLRKLPKDWVIR